MPLPHHLVKLCAAARIASAGVRLGMAEHEVNAEIARAHGIADAQAAAIATFMENFDATILAAADTGVRSVDVYAYEDSPKPWPPLPSFVGNLQKELHPFTIEERAEMQPNGTVLHTVSVSWSW